MKKLLLLSVLLTLLLTSCSDNVDLAIDNPTDFSVEVVVDTLRVVVPPKEVVWVEMGKGEHQLTLENDSIIKFNFTESVYMINPSLSEYLLTDEYYGPEMYQDSYAANLTRKEVTFLGIPIEGNYDVISDVINEVTWDYGPREALPEMVEVDSDESYTSLVKAYDAQEFMALMMSSYSGEE
ncbi:hypothetical protein HNV08_09650 [Winogradskyella eckloniae]|uniref:hypothetical protein n=1 Tax=Winogradskyella eckloniae TaxID=1089306 RepID=UPI001565D754|nr:hypothetical protein [Winogradskyella eckloniae]NRD20310.1 hypothetical protein [Winogradskyella eckloniae]